MSESTVDTTAAAATGAGRFAGRPAWLFCPADRPERWDTALASSDVAIFDLEDAVAPENKAQARQAICESACPLERAVLRINAAGTTDHELDMALLREVPYNTIMLPKAEDPGTVRAIAGHHVLLLIETPLGVERVGELISQPNVVGAMWGADDLVAAMGGTSSRHPDGTFRDVARYSRSRTLIAAKAHGRIALDAVHMAIGDLAGLRAECEDAAAIGFDATIAIHPCQLPVIRQAYAPTTEQVRWAMGLMTAVGNSGATTFRGSMVDAPTLRQAEQILHRYERTCTGGAAADEP